MWDTHIWSLLKELRFHMPHSVVKKKEKEKTQPQSESNKIKGLFFKTVKDNKNADLRKEAGTKSLR